MTKRPGLYKWPLMKRLLYWTKPGRKGCLEWTGTRYVYGYGQIRWQGKAQRAHRLMWELKRGPIPPGMQVLHKCANPPCINANHLYLGDDADNTADKIRMGNLRIGQRHGMAKLTDKQVLDIRKRVMSGAAYAKKHNVSRGQVYAIWQGYVWKHITGEADD